MSYNIIQIRPGRNSLPSRNSLPMVGTWNPTEKLSDPNSDGVLADDLARWDQRKARGMVIALLWSVPFVFEMIPRRPRWASGGGTGLAGSELCRKSHAHEVYC